MSTTCSYLGVKGVCGRKCFRAHCSYHIKYTSMTPCKGCSRPTRSPTGFCNQTQTGCRWKQQHRARVSKKAREEMDAYIFNLLNQIYANMN